MPARWLLVQNRTTERRICLLRVASLVGVVPGEELHWIENTRLLPTFVHWLTGWLAGWWNKKRKTPTSKRCPSQSIDCCRRQRINLTAESGPGEKRSLHCATRARSLGLRPAAILSRCNTKRAILIEANSSRCQVSWGSLISCSWIDFVPSARLSYACSGDCKSQCSTQPSNLQMPRYTWSDTSW